MNIKSFLSNILLSRKKKDALNDLALIIHKCKKVSSVYECREARVTVLNYLNNIKGKEYDHIRHLCADIMEYLADTCYHAEHLYHKPRHNGWVTKREFPNINDYVKLGSDI